MLLKNQFANEFCGEFDEVEQKLGVYLTDVLLVHREVFGMVPCATDNEQLCGLEWV